MPQRILVVDDEREIRRLVASYLIDDGFHVEELDNGRAVLERIQTPPPIDLIVLDVRMPELDGIETLRELRRVSDIHVIMLTAAAEETDRLIGLSVGADDYVTKPFSPREVVARVKAVLRRTRISTTEALTEPLAYDGITVDIDRHEVAVDGERVDLSALQFNLLRALAESPGRVFARHQLIDRVWGRDFYGEERIVDVHVGNLRKALGDSASQPRFIETVRGVGYRFIA
ncbi:MAG: response regulator transcription factor [Ilumatobacter sp.]|uniref:response regulator n=1 Tax=Ilumatobacter sp. TaxID=1967498 RepID=UPI00261C2164|nr:response regulator transcription factor [Ilumatobacter sp.]MDJ0770820.1 response regulator transcription factor [Ilumatobacter sp.]